MEEFSMARQSQREYLRSIHEDATTTIKVVNKE
jgi:hypothetical protein